MLNLYILFVRTLDGSELEADISLGEILSSHKTQEGEDGQLLDSLYTDEDLNIESEITYIKEDVSGDEIELANTIIGLSYDAYSSVTDAGIYMLIEENNLGEDEDVLKTAD